MQKELKLSTQQKLLASAVVFVVLLTGILSFLQYQSLVELREKSKAAAKENMRQNLQAIKRETKEKFEKIANDSLLPFTEKNITRKNPKKIKTKFAEIKTQNEGVEQLFLIYDCSQQEDNFAAIQKGDEPTIIKGIDTNENHDILHARNAYKEAKRQLKNKNSQQDFLFSQSVFHQGKSNEEELIYIFRKVKGRMTNGSIGFAGLALSPKYVKKFITDEFAQKLSQTTLNEDANSGFVVGVFDNKGEEIYSNGDKDAKNYEAQISLSPILSNWDIAARFKGKTVETLAEGHFRQSLLLTGIILVGWFLGLFLILRTIAKEMRLVQAKSDFVSNVSHELKTPLALIRLFAETLELGRVKSKEKKQNYYQTINAESRRLTQLINNILDFSKIEAGKKEYEFTNAKIRTVVTEVLESYEHQLKSVGFDLNLNVEPNLPEVSIDRNALSQAILNLLNNAVKYSEDDKKIEISLFKKDEFVAIEIADHGIGIPRSEQEKIFEKFYRVGTSLVHNTKGTGLGLALVKHIVEAHRGHITLESNTGKGSRFTIYIPISKSKLIGETNDQIGNYELAENTHR